MSCARCFPLPHPPCQEKISLERPWTQCAPWRASSQGFLPSPNLACWPWLCALIACSCHQPTQLSLPCNLQPLWPQSPRQGPGQRRHPTTMMCMVTRSQHRAATATEKKQTSIQYKATREVFLLSLLLLHPEIHVQKMVLMEPSTRTNVFISFV